MSKVAKLVVLLGFAAVLLVVVGLALFEAPLEYGLDCNRFSGVCTFTQRLMTRSRVGRARIDSLEKAEVRVGAWRRGRPRIMVWVVASDGDRFVADYGSRGEADAAVQRINTFLRDASEGRLVLTRSVRPAYWTAWALVPVVAALVVALAAVLFSKKRAAKERGETPRG